MYKPHPSRRGDVLRGTAIDELAFEPPASTLLPSILSLDGLRQRQITCDTPLLFITVVQPLCRGGASIGRNPLTSPVIFSASSRHRFKRNGISAPVMTAITYWCLLPHLLLSNVDVAIPSRRRRMIPETPRYSFLVFVPHQVIAVETQARSELSFAPRLRKKGLPHREKSGGSRSSSPSHQPTRLYGDCI